jgi:aldose 1-epimerase
MHNRQSFNQTRVMTACIELSNDSLRCQIVPDLGGAIAGLWLGDMAVLRCTPVKELSTARQAGSYPLVPFSNRIGQATLKWAGTSHPLVQNNGDEPHAIHGVGWQRPWSVLEADARFALLSYRHKPDSGWPFAFDASQAFKLSANTLELSLGITNQSDAPAPAGLGWHPYFIKRRGCHISFEATARWEMGADNLPTHRVATQGLDTDCAALTVDHCFEGWSGVVHLRDEQLLTRVNSNLRRLVVYTNSARDFVAIEPVSHVNNALNLVASGVASADALGQRVLQPGQSMTAEMSIQVERVA